MDDSGNRLTEAFAARDEAINNLNSVIKERNFVKEKVALLEQSCKAALEKANSMVKDHDAAILKIKSLEQDLVAANLKAVNMEEEANDKIYTLETKLTEEVTKNNELKLKVSLQEE